MVDRQQMIAAKLMILGPNFYNWFNGATVAGTPRTITSTPLPTPLTSTRIIAQFNPVPLTVKEAYGTLKNAKRSCWMLVLDSTSIARAVFAFQDIDGPRLVAMEPDEGVAWFGDVDIYSAGDMTI